MWSMDDTGVCDKELGQRTEPLNDSKSHSMTCHTSSGSGDIKSDGRFIYDIAAW